MDTNKAAYWIALGVCALGMNREDEHGRLVALHGVSEHAGSRLCRMAPRAEQTLAVARVLTSRERFPVDGLSAATGGAEMAQGQDELLQDQVRDEAELLRDRVLGQADVIRAQAEVQRAEVEQIRLRMRSRFRIARVVDRSVVVVCPQTGVRIAVNAGMRRAGGSPGGEGSF